jgi:pimeloyl-ACP methyl ester carboxylesterase
MFLTARDGARPHAWFFPAHPSSARSHLVLLLCHGNGGNISHRLGFYRAWLELGLNVFTFDYRGYGQTWGKPSEEGTYLDAQAALGWLRQKGFAPEHIILLGKSLGGGVASEAALREKIGGLILQSTFTSIADIGAQLFPWLPVRWMHRIRYTTVDKLPQIHVPVLIVHSRSDGLIPFSHAERNFAASNEPRSLLEIPGDHVNVLEAGRGAYLAGLERFLSTHFQPALAHKNAGKG